ncbi:MAG: hypothetical protein WBB28_20700 [Crinalium sp.]
MDLNSRFNFGTSFTKSCKNLAGEECSLRFMRYPEKIRVQEVAMVVSISTDTKGKSYRMALVPTEDSFSVFKLVNERGVENFPRSSVAKKLEAKFNELKHKLEALLRSQYHEYDGQEARKLWWEIKESL